MWLWWCGAGAVSCLREVERRGGEKGDGTAAAFICAVNPPEKKTMRAICLRFCFLILELFLDEGDGPQAQAGMVCCLAHEIEGSTNH